MCPAFAALLALFFVKCIWVLTRILKNGRFVFRAFIRDKKALRNGTTQKPKLNLTILFRRNLARRRAVGATNKSRLAIIPIIRRRLMTIRLGLLEQCRLQVRPASLTRRQTDSRQQWALIGRLVLQFGFARNLPLRQIRKLALKSLLITSPTFGLMALNLLIP